MPSSSTFHSGTYKFNVFRIWQFVGNLLPRCINIYHYILCVSYDGWILTYLKLKIWFWPHTKYCFGKLKWRRRGNFHQPTHTRIRISGVDYSKKAHCCTEQRRAICADNTSFRFVLSFRMLNSARFTEQNARLYLWWYIHVDLHFYILTHTSVILWPIKRNKKWTNKKKQQPRTTFYEWNCWHYLKTGFCTLNSYVIFFLMHLIIVFFVDSTLEIAHDML